MASSTRDVLQGDRAGWRSGERVRHVPGASLGVCARQAIRSPEPHYIWPRGPRTEERRNVMAPEWLTRSQNPWVLVLIAGICSALFGLLVVVHPWEGLTALIYLVAICFIVAGFATVLENDERFPRTVTFFSGLIWIVTG